MYRGLLLGKMWGKFDRAITHCAFCHKSVHFVTIVGVFLIFFFKINFLPHFARMKISSINMSIYVNEIKDYAYVGVGHIASKEGVSAVQC